MDKYTKKYENKKKNARWFLFDITKLLDKSKNGKYVPSLEVFEVVLVQCNLVDNQYQQKSEVLKAFNAIHLMLIF